jgi:hypothetical protein
MLRATVATASHADGGSGGQAAAQRLREANMPTCAIGLPDRPAMAGLRFGTPEVVRRGMSDTDMTTIAELVARALSGNHAPSRKKRRRCDAATTPLGSPDSELRNPSPAQSVDTTPSGPGRSRRPVGRGGW